MRLPLSRHPDTPCAALTRIEVEVERDGDRLHLTYYATGKIRDVIVPEHAESERTDGLWAATCFEAFVMPGNGPAYVEYNFSPSTRWAAYAFDSYRDGMREQETAEPRVHAHVESGELKVAVELQLPSLTGAWRLALTAVIEERSGAKSYWALAHPTGKPDFHHADGFVLDMA